MPLLAARQKGLAEADYRILTARFYIVKHCRVLTPPKRRPNTENRISELIRNRDVETRQLVFWHVVKKTRRRNPAVAHST
jgi:hypothetical protein